MTLEPLLAAPAVVQIHAFSAMAAFALGVVQLAAPKGVTLHRVLGWTWVALMAAIAGSSFWIKGWGQWSVIHVLSIIVIVMVPLGILFVRRGRLRGHKITMISLFVGALVIAGAFTFLPSRLMHATLF